MALPIVTLYIGTYVSHKIVNYINLHVYVNIHTQVHMRPRRDIKAPLSVLVLGG